MFGFVVTPRSSKFAELVPSIIGRMRTIQVDSHYETSRLHIWIYRTSFPNNYRAVGKSGRIVVISGTMLMGRERSAAAAEILLEKFERGSTVQDIYSDLRGQFALLDIDFRNDVVSIVTDRDGLMACYHTEFEGDSVFCSSLLLLAAIRSMGLDLVGVQEFVHGGACMAGRTLFEGVRRISKATIYRFDRLGNLVNRVWSLKVSQQYLKDSDRDIVANMHEMFQSALSIDRVDPAKSFGTDLTAGTDSRTVLSFLLHGNVPVTASTAGAADHVDVVRAREIARRAGTEFWWKPVENTVEFDQNVLEECVEFGDGAMSPFGLTKQLPYFSEKAKRLDILFGGNGGPLFKDHYWLFELNRIDRRVEPNWRRIASYSLTEGKVHGSLFVQGLEYTSHMKAMFLDCSLGIEGANNQKLDYIYYDLKCQYFAAPQFGFSNRFMDVYHPMCDGSLVEYSINIRPWIRLRARLQSELIYQNSKAIAWVLTDNWVPCVPDTGWRRPLRLARGVRYIRAMTRKVNDFVLNRRAAVRDARASSFVRSIEETALASAWRDPTQLRIAPLLNLEAVERLCDATRLGVHSGYVQRLYAVDAIVRKVEHIGQRRIVVLQS